MYEVLAAGPFATRRVALLHGRIPRDERDAIMRRFRDGEIDVLVATTVIEVGIDVAERDGDADRASRALRPLAAAPAARPRRPRRGGVVLHPARRRQPGRRRAAATSSSRTEDGFEIAREDLRLRGMGDLFGERQSGVPTFRDRRSAARRSAERDARARRRTSCSARDPELERPEHAGIAPRARRALRASRSSCFASVERCEFSGFAGGCASRRLIRSSSAFAFASSSFKRLISASCALHRPTRRCCRSSDGLRVAVSWAAIAARTPRARFSRIQLGADAAQGQRFRRVSCGRGSAR